jgi:hypothetical protein
VVLSIVIGVARAAAIVLVAVLAAIFPTTRVTLRIAILAAIFTARGFIGLASDGRCGEQGARDEQCSTQL